MPVPNWCTSRRLRRHWRGLRRSPPGRRRRSRNWPRREKTTVLPETLSNPLCSLESCLMGVPLVRIDGLALRQSSPVVYEPGFLVIGTTSNSYSISFIIQCTFNRTESFFRTFSHRIKLIINISFIEVSRSPKRAFLAQTPIPPTFTLQK